MAIANPEIHSETLATTFSVSTSETTFQFRNIKFASISQRFARSGLVVGYDGGAVDATIHGWFRCFSITRVSAPVELVG